jgi:hypothetical protein
MGDTFVKRVNRFFPLYIVLALLVVGIGTASGQAALEVAFLGRSDTTGDGMVDSADGLALYAGALDSVAVPVSAPDAAVLQFDVRDDFGMIAYTADTPDGVVLDVVQTADLTSVRVPVADLSPLSISITASGVWLVGLNAQEIPVLRGIDPAAGTVIAENTFRRPNTQVAIDPTGQYALAYHQEAGALSVLALPSLDLVMFELDGFAVTPPQWSPVEAKFLIGIGDLTNNADLSVAVVDVPALQVTEIDVPDYPLTASILTNWSDSGSYITYTTQDPANPIPAPLTIIDVAAGTTSSVQDPGAFLSALSWSTGDTYALVSRQPVQTDPNVPVFQEFRLYETATGALTPLAAMMRLDPLVVKWSPVALELGVLGQLFDTGKQGVYTVAVPDGEPVTVLDSDIVQFYSGDLRWSSAGQIVYTAPSGDAVTGDDTPQALYAADRASGSVIRLSPEGVLVQIMQLEVA